MLGGQIIDSVVASDSIRPAAHRVWWIATEQLRLVITSILAIGVVGLLGAIPAGRPACDGRARRDGAVPARAGDRLRRADR